MTIKHFQTKNGRFTTALVYFDGNRTRYDFDIAKINLALAIADKGQLQQLCQHFEVLLKLSLLTVNGEWKIDIY